MKSVIVDCLSVIVLIALILNVNVNAYVFFPPPPANEICFPINGTAPFEKY